MFKNNSHEKSLTARKLLIIDASYALEAIRTRGLEDSVTCRDLGGFFEHVWTVHPFATLVTSKKWTSRYGKSEWHILAPEHTFIEGKVGRFFILRAFTGLNFFLSQLSIFVSLVRLIRKEKISVIRVGDPHYLGFFGWALSRLCGILLAVRVAANYDLNYMITDKIGSPRLFRARWVEKIFEQFVLKRSDLVVCASYDNLGFVRANGARPEKSTLFRYGNLIDKKHLVDPQDRPDGRPLLKELGLESGRFLMNIGRLEGLKHPDHVLRILAAIRGRGHEIKAVLVGEGELYGPLIELAQELGVQDQVLLCGKQNQQWLATLIPYAAVIVSPITGRALTEAAFGAAPIVAYDLDWQSELIQTGVTGELVTPIEWGNMADAVERFLTNPSYARAMGNAVRQRALEMMDPEILNQHERSVYLKLFHGVSQDVI